MRNFDIAAIDQTDGLSVRTCQKLNGNFRALGQQGTPNVQITQAQLEFIAESVVSTVRESLLQEAYPVGSVIITNTEHDPRLQIGTWHRTAKGTFLLSADEKHPNGSVGGSWETTLEPSQIPPHVHSLTVVDGTGADAGIRKGTGMKAQATTDADQTVPEPVTVVPPYKAVLVYERVG
nr:MAG TPA: baseplate protein [Caudoviricetes sp.]